jgi:hypothetical protein
VAATALGGVTLGEGAPAAASSSSGGHSGMGETTTALTSAQAEVDSEVGFMRRWWTIGYRVLRRAAHREKGRVSGGSECWRTQRR